MKSTLIATAIATALFLASTPALAGDATQDTSPQSATAQAPWAIQAPAAAQEAIDRARPAIDAAENTPQAKGAAVAIALREAGFLSAVVSVKPGNVVVVELARPGFSGDYASYFSESDYLTKRQMEAGAVKASNRAKADGKSVKIDVRMPHDGVVEVVATSADVEDWKRWSAAVGVNNYGSRYSGSDLATFNGRVALGHGNEITGSLAHGFSNTDQDSFGGKYEAASVEFAHHGPHGTTRVELTRAIYTAGGPVRLFDLSGKITTFSVGHWVPLSAKWTVFGQIVRTENEQTLGIVDWSDKQSYTTAKVGVERSTKNSSLRVSVDKGLSGSRDIQGVPLLGTFNPNYTSLHIDWRGQHELGQSEWKIKGAAGAQVSTSNVPSNEAFAAGGPGRGRAWLSGATAGKRGAYGELILEAPTRRGFTPYVGVDTALIQPKSGDNQRLSSVFVGTHYKNGNWNMDAGVARAIGNSTDMGARSDTRIFVSASYSW